mgnify:CR=1 FL=1
MTGQRPGEQRRIDLLMLRIRADCAQERDRTLVPRRVTNLEGGSRSDRAIERDRREQTGPRLYDLLADPSERKNVAAEQPEVVARLRAKLEEQKAKGVAQPLPQ